MSESKQFTILKWVTTIIGSIYVLRFLYRALEARAIWPAFPNG